MCPTGSHQRQLRAELGETLSPRTSHGTGMREGPGRAQVPAIGSMGLGGGGPWGPLSPVRGLSPPLSSCPQLLRAGGSPPEAQGEQARKGPEREWRMTPRLDSFRPTVRVALLPGSHCFNCPRRALRSDFGGLGGWDSEPWTGARILVSSWRDRTGFPLGHSPITRQWEPLAGQDRGASVLLPWTPVHTLLRRPQQCGHHTGSEKLQCPSGPDNEN